VLRTNGANIDPDFGVITDYGSFFGGEVVATPVMDFSGPLVDIQDGTQSVLQAEYAPRLLPLDPFSPIAGLVQVAIDNSNVAGVTDSSASSAAAAAVSTGIEICIDLDELGWDGSQDILMGGWVSNDGFWFLSNQVIGGLPDNSDNIGNRDTNDDGMVDLDFANIAGDQFINLSAPPAPDCPGDLNGDNEVDFVDISTFVAAFNSMSPPADFNGDGEYDFVDISAFVAAFAMGCP